MTFYFSVMLGEKEYIIINNLLDNKSLESSLKDKKEPQS